MPEMVFAQTWPDVCDAITNYVENALLEIESWQDLTITLFMTQSLFPNSDINPQVGALRTFRTDLQNRIHHSRVVVEITNETSHRVVIQTNR